jgi:NADPH:quinone reductase-like Zn-dependent oxidoreductase
MRAVTFVDGVVQVATVAPPQLSPTQVLIDVKAAGLNGADLLQRRGLYPSPPGVADIPGLECAGVIKSVGEKVTTRHPGDLVMALLPGGGQSEQVVVDADLTLLVPPSLSAVEAGGFCEVFATAHDALITQCSLRRGERLLISGAAGGVGVAAIQIAKLVGAHVTASVRDAALHKAVRDLGADAVIDVSESENHAPYDVILELVGAPHLQNLLRSINSGARIWVIGVGAGARMELDLLSLMTKRATIGGSTLRARSHAERALVVKKMWDDLADAVSSKKIRVPIAAEFPLVSADSAYERFVAGSKFGKIVISMTARQKS